MQQEVLLALPIHPSRPAFFTLCLANVLSHPFQLYAPSVVLYAFPQTARNSLKLLTNALAPDRIFNCKFCKMNKMERWLGNHQFMYFRGGRKLSNAMERGKDEGNFVFKQPQVKLIIG